jgi:activator of HSP90 ATPase
MTSKTSTIIDRVIINASPDEVYDAFMDSKKHSEFTGSKATGKPKEGTNFSAWNGYISGKNIKLIEGQKIIQDWITTDWPKDLPPSRLELEFKDLEGRTEIMMTHSKVPADQEASLRQGWIDFYWKPLKEYFKNKKT